MILSVVKGVEAAGAGIMVLGGLGAFLLYLARLRGSDDASAEVPSSPPAAPPIPRPSPRT